LLVSKGDWPADERDPRQDSFLGFVHLHQHRVYADVHSGPGWNEPPDVRRRRAVRAQRDAVEMECGDRVRRVGPWALPAAVYHQLLFEPEVGQGGRQEPVGVDYARVVRAVAA